MAKCTKCGAELHENASFCVECGEKVAKKKFCSQCGTELPNEAKFCFSCGAKMTDETPNAFNDSERESSSRGGLFGTFFRNVKTSSSEDSNYGEEYIYCEYVDEYVTKEEYEKYEKIKNEDHDKWVAQVEKIMKDREEEEEKMSEEEIIKKYENKKIIIGSKQFDYLPIRTKLILTANKHEKELKEIFEDDTSFLKSVYGGYEKYKERVMKYFPTFENVEDEDSDEEDDVEE